jgi:hypothetical protein
MDPSVVQQPEIAALLPVLEDAIKTSHNIYVRNFSLCSLRVKLKQKNCSAPAVCTSFPLSGKGKY